MVIDYAKFDVSRLSSLRGVKAYVRTYERTYEWKELRSVFWNIIYTTKANGVRVYGHVLRRDDANVLIIA